MWFRSTGLLGITVPVPQGYQWKIYALQITYNVDATLGNHYPRLRINNMMEPTGPTLWWWMQPVIPSENAYYMFLPNGPEAQYMSGTLRVEYHPLPDMYLDSNNSIQIDVDESLAPGAVTDLIMKLWVDELEV
jgi:hypothetical protein